MEETQRKTAGSRQAQERACQSIDGHSLDLSGHHGRRRHQAPRAVQAAGGKYKVVKNTLAERAGAGTPAENLLKNLSGTNSIAYTATDPVALAKALTKVAKDVPAFSSTPRVEGRVISIREIQQLANLASKAELN